VYRLKTNTTHCLTALLIVGVGLSACQTGPSSYSTSFSDGAIQPANTTNYDLPLAEAEAKLSAIEESLVPTPRAKPGAEPLLAGVQPRIVDADLQCVPFARDASGIDIRGNANRWWKLAAGKYARTRHPQEGAVFVMRGYQTARRGHVAVVKQVLDPRTIVVDHANWGNDGRIYLSAPMRDESAKNDWSKVRVWYTPTNQWGRRLYRAKGFILPTTAVAGSFASGSN
jgi:hypothetical protein